MNFHDHSKIKGQHAFLGASKYHWLNYDEARLVEAYANFLAKEKGTELHDFAAQCIRLNQKLPRSQKTLNMYVNDAIGFKMTPEQVLYFSENCFGTADAISFRNGFLRVHDLKTGQTPARMEQLLIYVALFCLEYHVKPEEIDVECRLYQLDDIQMCKPTPEEISMVMDKIVDFDKILKKLKSEEE